MANLRSCRDGVMGEPRRRDAGALHAFGKTRRRLGGTSGGTIECLPVAAAAREGARVAAPSSFPASSLMILHSAVCIASASTCFELSSSALDWIPRDSAEEERLRVERAAVLLLWRRRKQPWARVRDLCHERELGRRGGRAAKIRGFCHRESRPAASGCSRTRTRALVVNLGGVVGALRVHKVLALVAGGGHPARTRRRTSRAAPRGDRG